MHSRDACALSIFGDGEGRFQPRGLDDGAVLDASTGKEQNWLSAPSAIQTWPFAATPTPINPRNISLNGKSLSVPSAQASSKLEHRKDQTMAQNVIQPGRVVTLVAPTGGVLSGQAVQVGALFGIAALDAIEGADVEVALEGVWELPKAAVAIAQGAPVFWDAATGNVAANIGTSNALIGGATEARGTSDLTIRVRLNGI
jgi:predicted RecA/RadA family phage recombinase